MAPITVKPTKVDIAIARAVAKRTNHHADEFARALTWGADEHILLALAALGWVSTRTLEPRWQRAGTHMLVVTAAASLLPHLFKSVFDQTRPDRTTVLGHLHGVSFSGRREDAFPSGHALHMGALASAAGTLPATPRRVVRGIAVGLSLTRIVVLAHWATDIVVGFTVGALLERLLRLCTGYPLADPKEIEHADP